MKLRLLGSSQIAVTPVALGLWPIAGMTTLDTTERDSLDTIRAALDCGINFFDTAYCYGADGISEQLLGRALHGIRDQAVVATKCGIHWAPDGTRINDASPSRIRTEIDSSLQRLQMEQVDLLYLHSADGRTAIEDTAAELAAIQAAGKCRIVGVSNLSFDDLKAFHAVCPVTVVQYRYNLLQRELDQEILPWCRAENVSAAIYWPLMKGMLGGKMRRDWKFSPADKRLQYPMFQPPQWQWNQNFLDRLETIAVNAGMNIPQLAVAWSVCQPGVTVALCGAKRPWQIAETAVAMNKTLDDATLLEIRRAIAAREQVEAAATAS